MARLKDKFTKEAVTLYSVRTNGHFIKNYRNPSLAVQIEAVRQNGLAIQWIVNPSEVVQLEAVREDPRAIKYIKNPAESVKVYIDGYTAEHIVEYMRLGFSFLDYIRDEPKKILVRFMLGI